MRDFIIMVGLPGSGKSTIAKDFENNYHSKVFSSDEYRKKLLGSEENQGNNALVFNTIYADLKEFFKSGKDAILDATNITRKGRVQWINLAKSFGYTITAYVVNTKLSECVKRDSNRERKVGVQVMQKMIKRFECPQYFEGFDCIYITTLNPYNESKRSAYLEKMDNFDQNNHHHDFTVGVHCQKLSQYIKNNFPNSSMEEAGSWHDVGKMFTQTTDEEGESHYIGHANYSSYWILTHNEVVNFNNDTNTLLDIIFYVNEHMHIRDIIKSTKAVKKYKDIFGEKKYEELIQFNKADNASARIEVTDGLSRDTGKNEEKA